MCISGSEQGGLEPTDHLVEDVNAQLVSAAKQLHVGETVVSTGDHELKVVVYVGNARDRDQSLTELSPEGKAATQEHEVEQPSKGRKQESDPDLRTRVRLSIRDDSV